MKCELSGTLGSFNLFFLDVIGIFMEKVSSFIHCVELIVSFEIQGSREMKIYRNLRLLRFARVENM